VFTEEKVGAHVDALYARIAPALQADPFVDPAAAARAPAVLEQYVRERRAFLRGELVRLAAHGQGALVINELAVGPGGYVELHARGDRDVPVEGLVLTDDLRAPFAHRLPAGLVVPAHGFLRLWASGDASRGPEHLPFTLGSAGGELGLFDGTHAGLPLDVVYFGPRTAGSAYGRLPDGAEALRGLAAQTPGTANR
jgi:spore coat protein H